MMTESIKFELNKIFGLNFLRLELHKKIKLFK